MGGPGVSDNRVGFVRVYGVGWGGVRRMAGTFGCCGRGKVSMVVTGVLLLARWGLEWHYRRGDVSGRIRLLTTLLCCTR